MPQISRFFGIVIYMYYDDHPPPHFHAKYGNREVQININDLSVINGSLPARALGLVIEWASQHKDEIKSNWDLVSSMNIPHRIEPLK